MKSYEARLDRLGAEHAVAWIDRDLLSREGVLIAFSERTGGVSHLPFDGLNLAAHVGDDHQAVDRNRSLLLETLGIRRLRDRLTLAEQVHGDRVRLVGEPDVGCGAAASGGRAPIPESDAILTMRPDAPLMLCFADCVPVILVAPGPAVAVVHAGWRGALASLPGTAVAAIASEAGCDPADVVAYIGPHICAKHYQVADEVMDRFVARFGTDVRASFGGLDLDDAVAQSLFDAGVSESHVARLGTCTAEATDRFFSYRAEGGTTGRHAALACIVSP
jgi:YfiH family protein